MMTIDPPPPPPRVVEVGHSLEEKKMTTMRDHPHVVGYSNLHTLEKRMGHTLEKGVNVVRPE